MAEMGVMYHGWTGGTDADSLGVGDIDGDAAGERARARVVIACEELLLMPVAPELDVFSLGDSFSRSRKQHQTNVARAVTSGHRKARSRTKMEVEKMNHPEAAAEPE